MNWAKTRNILSKEKNVLWFYAIATVIISIHRWALSFGKSGYTNYENYVIFRNSFAHLLSGQNIYAAFPDVQWDLFKYSPAFALFMAPFSLMPDWLGLSVWNLLNAMPLVFGIMALPMTENKKIWLAWFILLELITSMQSSQSNGLMLGLMLWSWVALERRQGWFFGFCTAAAVFIKIFGLFCLLPALLYPDRVKNYAWTAFWGIVLTLVPALVIGPGHLYQVYLWWAELLRGDQAVSLGISVQGLLFSWFGLEWSKSLVALLGLGLMTVATLLPFLQQKNLDPRISERHKILSWTAVLIWVVIFNHKAESPTFVIAMLGVGLIYLNGSGQKWELSWLVLTFLLVSLSPTDLFPRYLREQFIQPYVLKALPCIVVWSIALFRLFQNKSIHV